MEIIKSNKAYKLPNSNHTIQILKAPIENHAAYFIIECDASNKPLKLSYCDGNLPCAGISTTKKRTDGYGHGEVIFDLDSDRIEKLSGSNLLEKLSHHLSEFSEKDALLRIIDVCAIPLKTEEKILTKPQNRGNCSYKSFNITARAVMSKIHPELTFEVDGKPGGDGYKAYKKHKNDLIKVHIEDLITMAAVENKEKFYYQDVIDTLKENLLPKAINKKNSALIKRIEEAVNPATHNPPETVLPTRRNQIFRIAQSTDHSLQFFKDGVVEIISAKDAAIKKLDGIVDLTSAMNSSLLEFAAHSILSKAAKNNLIEASPNQEIDQSKFKTSNYQRHSKCNFKDVDLANSFMNSFANCTFEGCDLSKISQDKIKFVNCAFGKNCTVPKNWNNISAENFSECRFTKDFLEKMGDEKESFMRKFEITETKEGDYRSSKRLIKQNPETIIQPIMAFKLKASLELIR